MPAAIAMEPSPSPSGFTRMRKFTRVAQWVTPLLLAGAAAFAQQPLPANPTADYNDIMTKCLEQSDPALRKEDAIQRCKEKWKQGLKVDTPKKPKPKPSDTKPGK
jgi:hypothetical protein